MGKRKICCFCERWASGGIESFLCNALEQLDLSELEVDIVAAKLDKSEYTARLERVGVGFRQLSGSLRDLPENYRSFRRLLWKQRYDVAHFHLYQGLSLAYCRIARQEGVPVRIVHSHNEALRPSLTKPLKLLLHRWGRKRFSGDATQLWACSQAAAEFLFGAGSVFTVIPNGIDTARFRFDSQARRQLREELGLGDCLTIGNVGRLCSQKNQEFLLDIFTQLVQQRPDSRLVLVGDGKDRRKLEHRAAALGINGQVIFYGQTVRVAPLLCAMDVFVMPSLFEGLPLAVLEAQASGLPVLCSQGLSEEVKLTDLVDFLSLDAGPKAWAERMAAHSQRTSDREHYADVVAAAGFDAKTVAQRIGQVYLGRNDGTA